jgi:hypothetical protein
MLTPEQRQAIQDVGANYCQAREEGRARWGALKATMLLRAAHLPDGAGAVTEDEWPAIFMALERSSDRPGARRN